MWRLSNFVLDKVTWLVDYIYSSAEGNIYYFTNNITRYRRVQMRVEGG